RQGVIGAANPPAGDLPGVGFRRDKLPSRPQARQSGQLIEVQTIGKRGAEMLEGVEPAGALFGRMAIVIYQYSTAGLQQGLGFLQPSPTQLMVRPMDGALGGRRRY